MTARPAKPATPHRTARMLMATLMSVCATSAAAAPVFECTDGHGLIAFQDRACAPQLHQKRIAIAPAPTVVAPTGRSRPAGPGATAASPRRAVPARSGQRRNSRRSEPVSYECRVSNGEVFYRHSPCPKTVSASSSATRSAHQRGRSRVAPMRVVSHPVSRTQACRQINARTVSDREGHARDEQVSTYERNLGRDPCRRY
ncbi:MAG TPA: DUF4124 domain-containing protein [Rhodanobacteraceae bacterium]|nr:DUF4124 domain-containing protein [Rhodanobacteraceae bacterium]